MIYSILARRLAEPAVAARLAEPGRVGMFMRAHGVFVQALGRRGEAGREELTDQYFATCVAIADLGPDEALARVEALEAAG